MSRSAVRVKDQGLRYVSDGDSPALLATTFPRWPVATMATRRDAQLINALSKLGLTHMGY